MQGTNQNDKGCRVEKTQRPAATTAKASTAPVLQPSRVPGNARSTHGQDPCGRQREQAPAIDTNSPGRPRLQKTSECGRSTRIQTKSLHRGVVSRKYLLV